MTDKEGYLRKQGEKFKTWKKRWFVLKRNELNYYEKKGDKKLKGTIVLEPDFKISVSSIKSHCFQIMPHDKSKRIYYIHGENDKEAEEWITTLEKAKMVSSTPLVPSTPSTPNSVKVENKETKKEEPNIEEKGNKTGKKG